MVFTLSLSLSFKLNKAYREREDKVKVWLIVLATELASCDDKHNGDVFFITPKTNH